MDHSILHLAIDLQQRFLHAPGHEADHAPLLAAYPPFLAQLAARRIATVWVVTAGARQSTAMRRLNPVLRRRLTVDYDLEPLLVPMMRGWLLIKNGDSAFTHAGMLPWLRRRGVRELVLTGLYASHCLRATAADAAAADLSSTLLSDLARDGRQESPAMRAQRLRESYGALAQVQRLSTWLAATPLPPHPPFRALREEITR